MWSPSCDTWQSIHELLHPWNDTPDMPTCPCVRLHGGHTCEECVQHTHMHGVSARAWEMDQVRYAAGTSEVGRICDHASNWACIEEHESVKEIWGRH